MPPSPDDLPRHPGPPAPPPPPPAHPGPVPLEYRPPGPEPTSQWVTEGQPAFKWWVGLSVILWPVAAVIGLVGAVFGMIRMLSGC